MQELAPVTWPASLVSQKEKSALQIAQIYPGSPAEALGLQPGWDILQLDGADPGAEAMDRARRTGIRDLHLRDPDTGQIFGIGPGPFPLGMVILPKVNAGLIDQVSSRRPPADLLHRLWNLGNWKDFAALTGALETSLLPFTANLLGRFGKAANRKAQIFAAQNYVTQQFLSLAYLAAGQTGDSLALLDQADKNRLALGPDHARQPSSYWALDLFIQSLAAFRRGDAAAAMRLAEGGAHEFGADCAGLLRLYGELSGRGALVSISPLLNTHFPLDYSLPQTDVFGTWPSPGTPVSLSTTLDAMADDQILLVYALGEYRTNGPFQDEMASLIALHRHDPARIARVHIISGWTNPDSTWRSRNQIESEAAAAGLPVSVLSDPTHSVADALQITAAPSLYILDATGTVRATELLANESGYWFALARMAAPQLAKG